MLRELLWRSGLLVLLRIGGMLAGLLMTLMLTRSMPTESYGQIVVLLSMSLLGGMVLSLNLSATAIRYVPRYTEGALGDMLATYIRAVRQVPLWAGALVFAATGVYYLLNGWSHASWLLALWCAVLQSNMRIDSSLTQASGAVNLAVMPNMLLRPILLLALLAALLWQGHTVTPWVFVQVLLAVTLLVTILQREIAYRSVDELGGSVKPVSSVQHQEWMTSGLRLIVPAVFLELSVELIVLLASVVLSDSEVAGLGVVLRLQAIILFGVTSVNMVVGPRLSRLHARGETDDRQRLIRLSGHLKLWPSLMAVVLLYMFGEQLLGVFGEPYRAFALELTLFSLMPIILAIFGPTVLFITVLELQQVATSVFAAAFLALCLFVPLLGKSFGVLGVGIAALLVWLGWNAALHRLIRKRGGVNTAIA